MIDNHINIKNDADCCGCSACQKNCPVKAITMKENEEGFKYPIVDKKKCLECGKCKKVCPWINSKKLLTLNEEFNPLCYAVKTKDLNIQLKSSSGGVFGTIAKSILQNDGFVCGAFIDEKMKVKHKIINNELELLDLLGSKYVLSDLGECYTKIKELLNNNNLVLFVGVPCQVNGLISYLGKEYENLYTIELICHGAPSQKAFTKYIKKFEQKNNCTVIKYEFRNKSVAKWGTYKGLITYKKNNKVYTKKLNADFDKYFSSFLNCKNLRESCYKCKFATKKRNADLTIGDFWGVEKILPSFLDINGVSEILVNTEKGYKLFNNNINSFEVAKVDYNEIVKYNGQLISPSKRPDERNSWYKNIDSNLFYENKKTSMNLKNIFKLFIPSSIKIKIKKLIRK